MRKLSLYLFAAFLLTSCDNLKTKGKSASEDDTEETTTKKKKKKVLEDDEESEDEGSSKKRKTTDDEEITDNSSDDESDYTQKKRSNYAEGWSKAEQNTFRTTCVNGATESMGKSRAENYCDCMMNKLQKQFPDANSVDISEKEMTELAKECL